MASLSTGIGRMLENGETSFKLSEISSVDSANFSQALSDPETQGVTSKEFFEGNWKNLPLGSIYADISGRTVKIGEAKKEKEKIVDMAGTRTRHKYKIDFERPQNFAEVKNIVSELPASKIEITIDKPVEKTKEKVKNTVKSTDNRIWSGIGLTALALAAWRKDIL